MRGLFGRDASRRKALAGARVVPDSIRCVQCGICSYNCPLGLDVREHARLEKKIDESSCITCGECVKRCPRGVLRFESSPSWSPDRQR